MAVLLLGLAVRLMADVEVGHISGQEMPRHFREWFWEEYGEGLEPGATVEALGIVAPKDLLMPQARHLGESWMVRIRGPYRRTSAWVFLELSGKRSVWVVSDDDRHAHVGRRATASPCLGDKL